MRFSSPIVIRVRRADFGAAPASREIVAAREKNY
jgi:hypothetical protein